MLDVLTDSAMDVGKTLPILIAVYAFLNWIEARQKPVLLKKAVQFGPLCGAVAGAVPQCGFSAAASALFLEGVLAPATLVAVFLATSDEAIPVLIGSGCGAAEVLRLLAVKTALAVAGGYLLRLTILRKKPVSPEKPDLPEKIEMAPAKGCACCAGGSVLQRTLKTALLLFAALLAFNTAVSWIGESRLAALLLSGSVFQPLLCATVGLVPSCAVSVLLAELYAGGTIGFGSMVAGLSTGAGFGYMILLSDRSRRRDACGIIALTWLLAVLGGIAAQSLFG